MSDLSTHATAAEIMGDAFEGQAGLRDDADAALLLMSIATAYRVAARDMRSAIKAAAIAWGDSARCTLNHGMIKAPKCPACGATKP